MPRSTPGCLPGVATLARAVRAADLYTGALLLGGPRAVASAWRMRHHPADATTPFLR